MVTIHAVTGNIRALWNVVDKDEQIISASAGNLIIYVPHMTSFGTKSVLKFVISFYTDVASLQKCCNYFCCLFGSIIRISTNNFQQPWLMIDSFQLTRFGIRSCRTCHLTATWRRTWAFHRFLSCHVEGAVINTPLRRRILPSRCSACEVAMVVIQSPSECNDWAATQSWIMWGRLVRRPDVGQLQLPSWTLERLVTKRRVVHHPLVGVRPHPWSLPWRRAKRLPPLLLSKRLAFLMMKRRAAQPWLATGPVEGLKSDDSSESGQ